VSMDGVCCIDGFILISDEKGKAFLRVELHKPLVFPLLEPVKIIWSKCSKILGNNYRCARCELSLA